MSEVKQTVKTTEASHRLQVVLMVTGLCVISFAVLFVLYVFDARTKNIASEAPPVAQITPSLETNTYVFPWDEDYNTNEYVKKQFPLTGKFFEQFTFPPEVRYLSDTRLTSMKCAFSNPEYPYSYKADEARQKILEKNTRYKSLLKTLEHDTGIKPKYASLCTVKEPGEISNVSVFGDYSRTYIASNNRQVFSIIHSFPSVFMSCNYVIALSTSGVLYLACTGGDTLAHADIYKIQVTTTPFYSCVTDFPGPHPSPSTCKYSQ